jgi:hypothetical protein
MLAVFQTSKNIATPLKTELLLPASPTRPNQSVSRSTWAPHAGQRGEVCTIRYEAYDFLPRRPDGTDYLLNGCSVSAACGRRR